MDVGLGSVFDDFSTYQGKTVGTDTGPAQTVSAPNTGAAGAAAAQVTRQPSNQFDFDFSGQPQT